MRSDSVTGALPKRHQCGSDGFYYYPTIADNVVIVEEVVEIIIIMQ